MNSKEILPYFLSFSTPGSRGAQPRASPASDQAHGAQDQPGLLELQQLEQVLRPGPHPLRPLGLLQRQDLLVSRPLPKCFCSVTQYSMGTINLKLCTVHLL